MKIVFTSYIKFDGYNDPTSWLKRIKAYTGILEVLAINNEIISIEQINYVGDHHQNGVAYQFKRFKNSLFYRPVSLNRYINRLRPDIVFIQSLHFPLQVILLRIITGGKPKIIIQNHAEKPFGGPKKFLQKIADRYVDAYLFASKAMGMEWVTSGNLRWPDKIYEVMELSSVFYPVDRAMAQAKTNIEGDLVFLWVGRLDQNKDPLTVIKAFLKFAAKNPGVYLYMLYHTEELLPQIKQLLSTAPNSTAIKLIGKIPNEEMLYWYNSADFMVSGSHYEGSGTAVCEAMSCGCVPVVTDIFSFRMITDNGNIGLLYPPGNDVQLFDTLMQAKHLDLQKERAKALAYFEANLSFKAIAQKIQDIAASL